MDKPINLVEIQQVSKAYGSLVALNNINLKLETGKIKIMISKRLKKHIELMMQVIDKLEGEF